MANNKLVDLDRLSKLAKALDDRAKAAVNTEKERALAAEGEIDGKIGSETGRATAAEKALEAKITTLNGADSVEGSVAKKIKDAVDPVSNKVNQVSGKVDGLESTVNGLNGQITTGDANTLRDAKAYADTKIAGLVDSAPENLNTLKELADAIKSHNDVYEAYVGTVNQQLATKVDKQEGYRLIAETEVNQFKAKAEVSAVNAAKAEAIEHTDTEVGKINGSIGGINTKVAALEKTVGAAGQDNVPATGLVKDVADIKTKNTQQDSAIAEAKGVADSAAGKVTAVEGKVKALETAVGKATADEQPATGLFKEVADIKTKNTQQDGTITAAKNAADAAQGTADTANATANAAKSQANTNLQSINTLKGTVGNAEGGLVKDNTDNKAAIAAINHSTSGILAQSKNYTNTEIGKVSSTVSGIKSTVDGHTTTISENTAAISGEVTRAKAAEKKIDDKVNILNGAASVSGSVDNKIQAAIANIPTNENVKAMVGAVVNSLAFNVTAAPEGGSITLDLSLGGVQSIAKKTINIPMATDKDIDAIIAGLDAPQA